MEDRAAGEVLSESVSKPYQVSGIVCSGRRRSLDLEGQYRSSSELGHQIDLVTAVLFA